MIYTPQEDSYLLEKYVKRHAFGRVLDIGSGSGIQAMAALPIAEEVVATDIDDEALEHLKDLENKHKNLRVIESNLFENIDETFDTIIFNPPYLPEQEGEEVSVARAVSGGKKGYEVLAHFFQKVDKYLNPNGKILIVFSSLTNRKIIDEMIKTYGFKYELLEVRDFDFEKLYVYLIMKGEKQ